MNKWITDRRPTEGDCAAPHYCVYDERGYIVHHMLIVDGEPWKPIPKCEPYGKTKRYVIETHGKQYGVKRYSNIGLFQFEAFHAMNIPTREAAERIAAIYEEVMP